MEQAEIIDTFGIYQWIPWLPPLAYIYPPSEEALFQSLLCSAAVAVSRSGLRGDVVPAPFRREDSPLGAPPSSWMPPGCVVSNLPMTMGP